MLTADDRHALLALARASVSRAIGTIAASDPPAAPIFARRAAAFVTLHVGGDLRGCIGVVECDDLLGRVVRRCAVAAALDDPRFPPLTASELETLSIEISVLSPLQRCRNPEEIVIGRHGLSVELNGTRGLLLPQVARLRRWSIQEFLRHTCLKAGLPPDAWRHGAAVYCFEAEVFGEHDALSV
jgi:AmmeMemoRadiSam system protein A